MENTNETKTVEIFSTESCHYCHLAKEWFDANDIKYIDHNVREDREQGARAVEISGQMGVPVILIGNDVVVGFNEEKLKELLGK